MSNDKRDALIAAIHRRHQNQVTLLGLCARIDTRTAALIDAASKERGGDALDAERYRFLRDQNIFELVGSRAPYAVQGQSMTVLDGVQLDIAIDAIATTKATK